jgi:hypothetical protein
MGSGIDDEVKRETSILSSSGTVVGISDRELVWEWPGPAA